MANYLIPYVDPRRIGGHEDPLLQEFTYGDNDGRGKILRTKVRKGDFLFFHTSTKGKNAVTAYYCVEKVMPTQDAQKDALITSKYRNPHLHRERLRPYDTIVFGAPVYSRILRHPFVIGKEMLERLSSKPRSISRPWVKLSDNDVKLLLKTIKKFEEQSSLKDTFLSSNEVEQLQEEDIEGFIESNPRALGKNLAAFKRQHVLESGDRVDLLLKDGDGLVVVEIKKEAVGRETFDQVTKYLKQVRNEFGGNVRGVIVCSDVLPAFEKFFEKKVEKGKIEVYFYSWKFNLRPMRL